MEPNNDKKTYYIILFEYYKELLTTKQQEIFIGYYGSDYSLSEMAESLSVSRNAVWDTLKKVISSLEKYEMKLRLYEKDQIIHASLQKLKEHTDEEGLKIIQTIEEME